ncbi:hypothetical protein BRC2024_KWYBBTRE_CDS_0255 [Acinetobacter phage vB_AbaM_AB-Navy-v2]
MKKMVLIASSLILLGVGIYYIPAIKIKTYEHEVDSLAFSYRVYKSSVCPNRAILKEIRDDYVSTVNNNNVTKLGWINDNFDSRFMETCLQLNPHRGEYQ